MRIVFMGTPPLAARILEGLLENFEVAAVYTRPDAVRGRGKKLLSSPVKLVAQAAGIPIFTPKSFKDEASIGELASLKPDVICVAAYGMILPKSVLSLPRFGCLNVHGSLLPRWRGAAPLERAILAGDEYSGVSIMLMEEGLDTGPYCLQESFSIGGLSMESLEDAMALCGARLLCEALDSLEEGELIWSIQPEDAATYAHKLEKGELNPFPTDTVSAIDAKVRASSAAHPAKIILEGRGVTLEKVAFPEDTQSATEQSVAPGQALFDSKHLYIGASDGPLELLRVKPDGKKSMEAASFALGIPGLKEGTVEWSIYE